MQAIVMPAWMTSIEVRKDGSGNIELNLDSSTPHWNDAILAPIFVSFRTFVVLKSLLSTGITVTSISAIESLR